MVVEVIFSACDTGIQYRHSMLCGYVNTWNIDCSRKTPMRGRGQRPDFKIEWAHPTGPRDAKFGSWEWLPTRNVPTRLTSPASPSYCQLLPWVTIYWWDDRPTARSASIPHPFEIVSLSLSDHTTIFQTPAFYLTHALEMCFDIS